MSHMHKVIVVCRFIGAFKNAHKWANYRYVSSAATKATQQMGIFQRELFNNLAFPLPHATLKVRYIFITIL